MKLFTLICFSACLLFLFSACRKEGDNILPDSSKEILAFQLKKPDGTHFDPSEISTSIQGTHIDFAISTNISFNSLIPEIIIKGASISPASGVPQNFTKPVHFVLTAADGTTITYTVTVRSTNREGTVYIGSSDNSFYAINASTGDLKWKYEGTAPFAYSGGTYANETVYVGSMDSYIYALDARTGVVRWRFQAGLRGVESDAVVVNGTLYVGSNDHYLYALDAETGQLKWKFLTRGKVSTSPTIANGVVYFGSSDSKLYALDAATGQQKWAYATNGVINQSGPAIANGTVYVGCRNGYLHAVDAATGTLNWRYSANGISLEKSSPTVANGIVYIGSWLDAATLSKKGSLHAIDATTGKLIWEKLNGVALSSSPIVANGRVYITSVDDLYALDAATGTTLWEQEVFANSASPALFNGNIYVGGGGSRSIYAFDATTGTEKWSFFTPGLVTSCPIIVTSNGEAYYSGDSGLLN